MRSRNLILFILPVFFVTVLMQACKEEPPLPHNPYEDILRDDTTGNEIPVDSLTITYVHKKVLSTRCALPGCHVGNFEPDFRTPQSSFSTLVYANIVKNNVANAYKFRVIPFDTTKSVLYQRITNCCYVNVDDRMPQDNIGVALPDSSISLIAQWIMRGARDMYGNIAKLPNTEPVFQYYYGVDANYQIVYSNNRLDSVPYNPFILPDSVGQFYFAIAPTDDSTPMGSLKNNKLKISLKADDFTTSWSYTPIYVSALPGWVATVDASILPANDTLFMRYYCNDGSHGPNTEYPRNDLIFPYKNYWSFIRKP